MLTKVRSMNRDCGETTPFTLGLIARGLRSCTIKSHEAGGDVTFARLRRLFQVPNEAGEQATAIGAAHDVFDVVFRMRHHAEHIAALVDDARDRMRGAVDVGSLVDDTFGRA